jgi:hypothetical protein
MTTADNCSRSNTKSGVREFPLPHFFRYDRICANFPCEPTAAVQAFGAGIAARQIQEIRAKHRYRLPQFYASLRIVVRCGTVNIKGEGKWKSRSF